jgi:hypothetical protein
VYEDKFEEEPLEVIPSKDNSSGGNQEVISIP